MVVVVGGVGAFAKQTLLSWRCLLADRVDLGGGNPGALGRQEAAPHAVALLQGAVRKVVRGEPVPQVGPPVHGAHVELGP